MAADETSEVATALRNWGFGAFVSAFEKQKIETVEEVLELTMEELKTEFGMESLGDRKRFVKAREAHVSRLSSLPSPASPSSSSPASLPEYKFDVFICHRGSDLKLEENVKLELAVPLYHHLSGSFNVFLDKFGLSISIPSHGMLQALVTCNRGVIFFSRGFIEGIFNGSAPWCLLELRVLHAKHQWLYYKELQEKGMAASKPEPRIFAVAVPPVRIDTCWSSEYATKPLPMVTHTDLMIEKFELDGLKRDLAAVSPMLVELMDDPTLTLQSLLSRFPFISLAGKDEASRKTMCEEVKLRLEGLRTQESSGQFQPLIDEEEQVRQLRKSIKQQLLVSDSTPIYQRPPFNLRVYSAAETGNLKKLRKALATQGPLIDAANPEEANSLTPLCVAARNGHVAAVKLLHALGSKALDVPNNLGWTPMHFSAENNHVEVVELLVHLGSKAIDTPENDGHTPLAIAALNGHVPVIERLIRLGSQAIDTPNQVGQTPLYVAARGGFAEVIETLVRLGSNAVDTPENDIWVPLGVIPRNTGWFPMTIAASRGHVAVIETLVRLGSQIIDIPCESGDLAMHAASAHANVVETLVRLGSQTIDTPNKYGWTVMHMAAASGQVSVIETLVRLESKALNMKENSGFTPLRLAKDYPAAVETLERLGAQ